MKRLLGVMVVAVAFSQFSLFAEDGPKTQFFGGLSVLSGKAVDRVQALGWQAGVTGNVNSTLGIVGDFAGQYKDSEHYYEYLGGPRFHARREKTTLFAHALFGGLTAGSFGSSVSGFTMGYGGGVDVVANDKTSVRLIQFDWLPTRIGGVWDKNTIRFGFGLVFGR